MRKPALARALRATLMLGAAAVALPAYAQTTANTLGLEQIIVTAQKREENLQRVPVAVTAFTAKTIQALRITDTRDLNSLAPGFTVGATPGGSLGAAYTLRGVSATGSFAGQGSGVAVYLDGVFQGSNTGLFFDLADIERIEILRGPQGTLFGRNGTGGAISIFTHTPTGEFKVHQQFTVGNREQFRSKTRIDLPAFGALKTSFTYQHNQIRGDIRNIGAGTQWDFTAATDGRYGIRTAKKWLGSNNSESIAATGLLDYDNVQVTYKFDYTQKDYTDNGQGIVDLGFGGPGLANGGSSIAIVRALYNAQPASLRTPMTRTRPKAVNNSASTGGDIRIQGHNLTINWTPTDDLTLKNIFAYRKTRMISMTGVDGFGFVGLNAPVPEIFNLPAATLLGAPAGTVLASLVNVTSDSRQHQYSDEFQVNWNSKWANVTAGFFWYKEYSASVPWLKNNGAGPLSGIMFAQPVVAGQPVQMLTQNYVPSFLNSKSHAVFAQIEGHITDQLDVIAGGRYTWDKKDGIDALSLTPLPVRYRLDEPTWLLGLNYRFNDQIMTYAKVSTGFISGGQLSGFTYDTETAKSYEVGVKADFWDGRARTNLALYTANYGALQFPTTQNGLNRILNYGGSRARGFEVEATVIPMEGWTFTGNLGFTDFKLKYVDPRAAVGLQTTLVGVVATNRPKWTSSVAIAWEGDEMQIGGKPMFRLSGDYKSSYFPNARGFDDNGDGRFNSADQTWDIIHNGPKMIVNVRAGITEFPIGNGTAELAVWSRNLTDNKSVQFETFVLGYSASYERARTIGVDLTLDF